MIITSKMKVYAFILGILLSVGQGFALDCATGTGWGDFLTQEASKPEGENYYEIDSPEKLAWFACKVTNKALNSEVFKLTKSLDMQGKLFIPIGSGTGEDTGFKGTFDGQGFTILNLYINTSEINSDVSSITGKTKNGVAAYTQNIGLFGILSQNGTIMNLILKDVQIYAAASSGTTGIGSDKPISVGSVVGWVGANKDAVGKIENIVASGSIETSGATNRVGGIAGNVKFVTISNCVSSVSVTASGANTNVGGVVGAIRNNGNVTLTSNVYSGDYLYTVDGSIGAIAGSYENSSGTLTTEDLYYSEEFCESLGEGETCSGIGLSNGTAFNTKETDNLNSEEVVCTLNCGIWNEENKICEGDTSEVWSVGQSSLSMNGSDGYKITFNANGGVFASGAKTSKILSKNATITADEIGVPTREGKKFAGWATKADTTEPNPNLGVARAATVIYAVWYDYYPAIFESNPETHATDTVWVPKYGTVAVEGFAVPETYTVPDPENQDHTIKYYFTGWGNSSKMLEEDVDPSDQDTLHLADIEVTDTVRLYAVWTKAKTFSVTFDATLHGKTDVRLVKIVNEGEAVSEPDPNDIISDAGYKVAGWCEVENCTEENEYEFSRSLKNNLTLYARWNVVTYNINYELYNGTNGNNPSSYTIEDADIVLADPTKIGSVFEGWFYDDAFTNPATKIDAGSTGDKTVYAKWKQITYTIQYLSGNTVYATAKNDTKNYGETIQLKGALEEYAHGGCNQDGWSKVDYGQDGYGVDYELGSDYEDNANLKLFPHWTCNTYTITYEIFGASATNRNPTQYMGPAKLTLENAFDPAKKYFFMDNWYKEPTFKTAISDVQNIDADITLYARWYNKITYKPGSNVSGAKNLEEKKDFDKTYKFKTSIDKYVRANYTLDGWSLTDGGEKVYGLGDAYTTNANLTLYPHWTANTHTITYNNVETSELPEGYPETYTHEASVTLPVPTRNGYEFLGWYVDDEFDGDAKIEIPEGETEDKEFFAKWSDAVEYTATYNLNGGSMDGEESFTFTIESNDIDLATPTKNGYTFVGWLDGVTGDVVTVLPTGSFGDRTLTAQWSDPIEYTITYENVNGAANENATSYTIEQSVVLNNLEKDGFVFAGWFDNAEFEGNAATEISAGASGDTTFYAKWLEIFTITYAAGEGDGITGAVAAGTKTATEDATLSNDGFTREGYTQTGWKTEDGSVTYAMGATYTTDASVTLYPVWNVETYTITYHNIEGATFETPNLTTYTVEDGKIDLNSPAKTGYNFLGWSLEENSTKYVDGIAAGSTGEANFYANWELAPSPITVTASSGSFEYDGETHNATCSYEGVIPVGYSIAMVPSGSVQNVSEGEVTTSCAVTITDESGDDVTDQFTELTLVDGTISVVAKVVNYGGIAVIKDEDGTRAEIDDAAMTPINITNDVEVDHVTFNRNFPLVKYSTVFLPFSIDMDKVHGAVFYSVAMLKQDGKWVAGASPVKTAQLVANTPYLLFANEQNLTFDGPVTLNTSEKHDSTTVFEEENCQWTFKGTYLKHVWEAGDPELGKVYAFSAHDVSDDIKIGKFTKFGKDAWIRPMRAYLIYEQLPSSDSEPDYAPTPLLAKSFKSVTSTASIEDSDVPEWIDVVIIGDEDEQTTPIAQMNSRTGEVRMMDGWFDMKGRKLNGKPTAKGIYYNNGKRVFVK